MHLDLKQIHNVSRPGKPPGVGDEVELECAGGFVHQVDPITRRTVAAHKRFVILDDGAVALVAKE